MASSSRGKDIPDPDDAKYEVWWKFEANSTFSVTHTAGGAQQKTTFRDILSWSWEPIRLVKPPAKIQHGTWQHPKGNLCADGESGRVMSSRYPKETLGELMSKVVAGELTHERCPEQCPNVRLSVPKEC